MALQQYKRYKEEATLIVTSRLHCASPCIAMGIPTIFTRELYSPTLLSVDKYVHIYTSGEFDNIRWNPDNIDYEEEKKIFIEMFSNRIQDTYNKYHQMIRISAFYEDRPRYDYEKGYKEKLVELRKSIGNTVKCVIWGANIHARTVIKVLPLVFDNYQIVDIIDEYKEGKFYSFDLKKSSCINQHGEDVIYIIAANAAIKQASELLSTMNKKFILITY